MLAPAPAPAVFRFSRPAARRGGGSRRRRGDDVDVPWKRGGRRSTEVAPTHFRGADIPRRRESRRRRGCKIDIPRRRESRRRRGRGRGCFVAESRRARRERKRRREGAVARDVQLRLEAFQRRRLAPVLHALFLLFFRFRPRVWVDDVVLRRLRDKTTRVGADDVVSLRKTTSAADASQTGRAETRSPTSACPYTRQCQHTIGRNGARRLARRQRGRRPRADAANVSDFDAVRPPATRRWRRRPSFDARRASPAIATCAVTNHSSVRNSN